MEELCNYLNSEEYKEIFNKMLADCYKYAKAINAKGEPFPPEPLLMSLLLSQQKMIDWLSAQVLDKKHIKLLNLNCEHLALQR